VTREETLSRRKLLGTAAAGAAGITVLGSWAPKAFSGSNGVGERLVPPGKLSVQQFSIRHAITRVNGATMGRLGGPTFPEDPNDLGPLVPLPGGFAAVFEYLASVGYRGIEFFSFSQGANGAITIEQIRAALDSAGLASTGTHTGGLAAIVNPATRQVQIDIAHTLGHTMIGTAGDPVGGAGANLLANWQTAAQNYNVVGAALAAEGMRYYLYPEQNNFNFFNDPAHPELSTVHRLDWFTENTDPSVVWFEPDLLHSYAGRAGFPGPSPATMFDLPGWFFRNERRILASHIKDGSRLVPQPAPPANPFTQTVQRTPTFVDAIYSPRFVGSPERAATRCPQTSRPPRCSARGRPPTAGRATSSASPPSSASRFLFCSERSICGRGEDAGQAPRVFRVRLVEQLARTFRPHQRGAREHRRHRPALDEQRRCPRLDFVRDRYRSDCRARRDRRLEALDDDERVPGRRAQIDDDVGMIEEAPPGGMT